MSALIYFLSGALTGWFRTAAGVAMGAVTLGYLAGYFRHAARPVSGEGPPEEVPDPISLRYICEMCGLELEVIKVAGTKAPRHCGETMLLFLEER